MTLRIYCFREDANAIWVVAPTRDVAETMMLSRGHNAELVRVASAEESLYTMLENPDLIDYWVDLK